MSNSDQWNKKIYSLYAPFYDVAGYLFRSSRKQSIGKLNLTAGNRILIIGAGTGLDLPYIPNDVHITAVDITPAMIQRLRSRASKLEKQVSAHVMDATSLSLEPEAYDAAILHLILAVVSDPVACLQEAERVLKPGGQAVVFDKFVKKGEKPGFLRKLINPVTSLLATHVDRSFEEILKTTEFQVLEEESRVFDLFRIIKLQKPER